MTLHVERHIVGYRERILKHVLVSFHIGELRQFSFAHLLVGYILYSDIETQIVQS